MELIPQVVQAVAGQNYSVYVYFHDGTVRLLDASHLVQKGGVFAPKEELKAVDEAVFGQESRAE